MFEDFFDTDVIEEVRRNTKTKTEFGSRLGSRLYKC